MFSPYCVAGCRVRSLERSRRSWSLQAVLTVLPWTDFWQKTIRTGLLKPSKGTGYIRYLSREYPATKESGSFSRLENELYKQFFSEIIAEGESGIKGGNQFLDFIRFDIDIRNIKTLFRLRADTFEEDAREMYIAGGVLSPADFTNLNTLRDRGEFIDQLKEKISNSLLLSLLDELKSEKVIHDVETRLTRSSLTRWSGYPNGILSQFIRSSSILRKKGTRSLISGRLPEEKNRNSRPRG